MICIHLLFANNSCPLLMFLVNMSVFRMERVLHEVSTLVLYWLCIFFEILLPHHCLSSSFINGIIRLIEVPYFKLAQFINLLSMVSTFFPLKGIFVYPKLMKILYGSLET